jgi:RNA polymerase sigma-70 factor (ECF subfamily)
VTVVAAAPIPSILRRAAPDADLREIDAPLLDRCREGDPAALRAFVTRYQHMVFAFLSRTLGAGPHVEDLAQEVFLRACRALPRFDSGGVGRLSTWVLSIASHVAIDARRKRRIPTSSLDADVVAFDPDTPETERRRVEIGRAVERAAADLPDDQRAVFVLAEFHGLDMKAIAETLGIRENTVRTRLYRARSRLRDSLQSLWEDS